MSQDIKLIFTALDRAGKAQDLHLRQARLGACMQAESFRASSTLLIDTGNLPGVLPLHMVWESFELVRCKNTTAVIMCI